MRRTSLVEPVRFRPGWISAAVWLLALALFIVSGFAFVLAWKADVVADRLEGHGSRLSSELNGMNETDGSLPGEGDIAELAAQIERLNALTGIRHAPLPALLEMLEAAIPPSVWVAQLNYSTETGAFSISLLGENENDLPGALRRIEAVPALKEVILERQVRIQSGSRNLLQYDIRASAP